MTRSSSGPYLLVGVLLARLGGEVLADRSQLVHPLLLGSGGFARRLLRGDERRHRLRLARLEVVPGSLQGLDRCIRRERHHCVGGHVGRPVRVADHPPIPLLADHEEALVITDELHRRLAGLRAVSKRQTRHLARQHAVVVDLREVLVHEATHAERQAHRDVAVLRGTGDPDDVALAERLVVARRDVGGEAPQHDVRARDPAERLAGRGVLRDRARRDRRRVHGLGCCRALLRLRRCRLLGYSTRPARRLPPRTGPMLRRPWPERRTSCDLPGVAPAPA